MAIQKKSVINKQVKATNVPAEAVQPVSQSGELKATSLTALSMAKRRALKGGAIVPGMRSLKGTAGRAFGAKSLKGRRFAMRSLKSTRKG